LSRDLLRYDKMVETALRGVVREVLLRAAKQGLPGGHHFYLTFRTGAPGVGVAEFLKMRYPKEMTIVLEHQFWDLEVEGERFSVTLSFSNKPERLTVPFTALTAFADPSVKFGLQFQETDPAEAIETKKEGPKLRLAEAKSEAGLPAPVPAGENAATDKKPGGGEVVTLDQFRKK
jgi:uncharacterized protein